MYPVPFASDATATAATAGVAPGTRRAEGAGARVVVGIRRERAGAPDENPRGGHAHVCRHTLGRRGVQKLGFEPAACADPGPGAAPTAPSTSASTVSVASASSFGCRARRRSVSRGQCGVGSSGLRCRVISPRRHCNARGRQPCRRRHPSRCRHLNVCTPARPRFFVGGGGGSGGRRQARLLFIHDPGGTRRNCRTRSPARPR
mmetsp:Transcript_6638/g.16485  ORF Transcript_6638/g.16485 Transcript_6638/m.16485 type:complete len:203 (-) Transcript_6638:1099-1707(-)